jgi:uncharacterized protein RhaS with RHS repeats
MNVRSILLLAAVLIATTSGPALAVYHPTLGRWVQRDPIGYADGQNLYAAYHVMRGEMDPLGLAAWSASDCKEFFGPSENWDAVAGKRTNTERALRGAKDALREASPDADGYDELKKLVSEAEAAYHDSLDAYRFWRYMLKHGCDCCDDHLRNQVHVAVTSASWDGGNSGAKELAIALKLIAEGVRQTTGQALPLRDITGALTKYDAYREAAKDLTQNGALVHARQYGELWEACPKISDQAPRWHEAVDDWGNPH